MQSPVGGSYMAERRMGNLQRAITVGAGVGVLAAQVMQIDIGLALVVGALAGAIGAMLRVWGRRDDGSGTPRE
jgi:hypothetical protein